jgi:hypothetical protein
MLAGDLFASRIKLHLKIAIASIRLEAAPVVVFINLLGKLLVLWREPW